MPMILQNQKLTLQLLVEHMVIVGSSPELLFQLVSFGYPQPLPEDRSCGSRHNDGAQYVHVNDRFLPNPQSRQSEQ